MQIELHSPGVEIWEAAAKKSVFEINGTLLAIKCHLEVELQSCISWLLHQLLCSVESARDLPAGRDGAGGWLGRSVGAAGQPPSADTQLRWEAGGHLFAEGMKAAGRRQKGSNRKKKEQQNEIKSLIHY